MANTRKPTGKPKQTKPSSSTKSRKISKSKKGRPRNYIIGLSVALVSAVLLFVGIFFAVIQMMPFDPTPLTDTATAPTVVYAKDGSKYMTISSGASDLPYAKVPENLQDAIVATEDHTFWTSNSSFNLRGLLRAAFIDLWTKRLAQGGSTIPEQLAKIVYTNQQKTFSRKLQQIALGVQINRHFSKQEILTMYLNRVYLGENSTGVEQAAMRYFGVDLRQNPNALTWPQAALLAGLPQAPSAYDPLANPKLALERRNRVLDNLAKYGYLTEAQAAKYQKAPLGAKFHDINGNGWDAHPLFTNFLYDYANKQGISADQLFQQGINIYTTVDPKVQSAVDSVFWNNDYPNDFPSSKGGQNVEGAAVFIDPATGEILGGAGSRKADYARLGLDRIYSRSSPGSSIKPIMEYAPAVESGNYGPDSILDNTPHDFGAGYYPRNDDPGAPTKVTMRYALATSQNVAAVWLLNKIGIQNGTSFAERAGIDLTAQEKSQLGVAIGGEEVYPLQMAQAYSAFANHGVQMQAHLITRITNAQGEILYQYKDVQKQLMSAHTADVMTDMLHTVVTNGTGTAAQVPGWDVAGKTGTVQYDAGQAGAHPDWVSRVWFDGYTPNIVGSVYLGFDKSDPVHHLDWSPYPGAYTAHIFADIVRMSEAGVTPQHFTYSSQQTTQPTQQPSNQPVVSNLNAVWDPQGNGVQLLWSSTNNNVNYLITRRLVSTAPENVRGQGKGRNGQGGSSPGTVVSLGQTNLTQLEDFQVQPGATYLYAVQAVDPNTSAVVGPSVAMQFTVPTLSQSTPGSDGNQTGNSNDTSGSGNSTNTDTANSAGSADSGLGDVANQVLNDVTGGSNDVSNSPSPSSKPPTAGNGVGAAQGRLGNNSSSSGNDVQSNSDTGNSGSGSNAP